MAFGAKIKLSVDTSGASSFRSQIQKHVNTATAENPIKLKNFSVAITKEKQKQLINDLQTYLTDDKNAVVLKIKKIDANKAVADLRQQLQTMLSGLSITGLKEFLGETNIDKITEDIDKAKQSTSQWTAQMKVVDDISKKLGTTYKSALSGSQMIDDEKKISEITNGYNEWQTKVEKLRNTKVALSAAEIQGLQQEGIALQQEISLQQKEQAEKAAAANKNEINAKKDLALTQQQISLKKQVQSYILSNGKAYKTYGEQLDAIMKILESDIPFDKKEDKIKLLRASFLEIQRTAKAAGKTGSTFFNTLKKGWEKFGGWSLVTKSMMSAWRVVLKMIDAVKELDAAMTELKKVTDLTDVSYDKFLTTASTISKSVGASLADTVNATADFARLGYNLTDSTALAEAALVYKNVGDGIEDIGTASESLISTIKAFERFGESANDAMSIVDRFNEVGNNFAISSEGIGEALRRSASALATAGNSLNESIALITGMNAVVQDPESVGTALKTISMYLRAAKTEAEDAGDSVDGMANSVSELRSELLTLTKGKVDIMLDDKTFKSTYEIMKELSKVWSDLADVDRANILELIGGKRNANAITSLLTNFNDAENALQTASSATGSAYAENEKYLDSINGKIDQFRASFEALSTEVVNSSVIKWGISVGTVLVDILNVLAEFKLLLPIIVGTLVTIKGINLSRTIAESSAKVTTLSESLIFEKSVTDMLAASVAALTLKEKQLLAVKIQNAMASGRLREEEGNQILSTLGLTTAENALTDANHGLAISFESVKAAIPVWGKIAIAISMVLSVIQWVVPKIQEANKSISELNTTIDESVSNAKTALDDFQTKRNITNSIIPEFSTLAKGVDEFGNNIGLTSGEYERFWELNNKIAEMFPSIDLGLDSNGNHMLSLSYSAGTLRDSLEELINTERSIVNEKILENADEAIAASNKSKEKENREKSKLKEEQEYVENLYNSVKYKIDQMKSLLSVFEEGSIQEFEFNNTASNQFSLIGGELNAYNEQLAEAWYELSKKFEDENHIIDWKTLLNSTELENFASDEFTKIDGEIDKKLNNLENKSKSRSQKIAKIANAYLQSSFDYEIADEEIQIAISKIVSGIDFDSLDISNRDDLEQFIDENIIKIIKESTPEVKNAITDLFDLKPKLESGDLSASDYLNQIDTIVEILNNNGVSKDVIDSIKNIANYGQISDQLSEIERKTGVARDSLKNLSAEEIRIAYDIVKDKGSISIDELIKQINIVKQQTINPIEVKTNIESLSGIESMSEGFDQLIKIYNDIKDGGDFDWSSILNNEDFERTFGNLGDDGKAYKDFIETIANSPNDINACQEAFNKLSSAYINNRKELDGVTESTRAGTIAMLKQKGVANAAEIVDKAIEINKIRLKYTTGEYTNKTYEQIKAQYDAAAAGSLEKQVLAELAIQKMLVNKNQIQTSSDVAQLLNLANYANVTAESLIRVSKAMALLAKAEKLDTKAQESVWYEEKIDTKGNTISVRHENGRDYQIAYEGAASLRAEAQKLLDEGIDFNNFNIEDFVAPPGGGGGGSSGGSGSSKETEPEIIDWIEVKINRIKENIDRLANKAKSSFKSITDRIKATNDEIKLSFDEISVQQKAYDRYMQEADKINLSSDLKSKVQNGTIDISAYDKDIADSIKDYQDFYEKAIACKNAVDELKDSISELYQDKFDAVESDFDNQISLIEHAANEYNNELDILEKHGYFAQTKYYNSLIAAENQTISKRKDELTQLRTLFEEAVSSGKIKEGSESWYDMKDAINSVSESIQEAEKNVIEFNNSIRELEWEKFDYALDRVSKITEETDFLINLLDSDKLYEDDGKLTDNGLTQMALREQNYAVYMRQAAKYADEYKKVSEDLAKDPYNKTLIERKEELLGLQQESIEAAQDEKQAIVDMVEEGINKELESIQKLIDAYTDALDSAKSLSDYQKNVSDKTSEIASLRKQLLAYSNDGSEETRATIQKLNVELKKAEEDLQDTEYDRYISDQKELLDNLYTEYETTLNQRLDNIDALMSDVTSAIDENSETIENTILLAAAAVGYNITDSIGQIWSNDNDKDWKKSISDILSNIYNSMGGTESTLMGDVNGDGKITGTDARLALRAAARLENLSESEMARADLNGDGKITSDEARSILLASARLKELPTGKNTSEKGDYIIIDDIFSRLFGNTSFADSINGVNDITDVSHLTKSNIPISSASNNIGDVTYQITIPIDHVLDYEDFMNQMKSDSKFADFLKSATIDRLTGANSLSKNKYIW